MLNKKKLAAKILKTSMHKIKFAPDALEDIQKALTRSDIRGLIAIGKVWKDPANEHSRAGARKNAAQKKKGRRTNRGSKKGKKYSVVSRKTNWINRVRTQRNFLQLLKEKGLISTENFRMIYLKIKGGFFRNKRHLKLYLNDYKLLQPKQEKQ
jgi:large subunit ribosomal protein L19e